MDVGIVVLSEGNPEAFVKAAVESARDQGRVEVMVQPDPLRRGPSSARNEAANVLRSEWLVFLDGDDLLHPDYLRHLSWAATIHEAEIAYSDAQWFGTERKVVPACPMTLEALRRGNSIPIASLISRSAFERLGGFDPEEDRYADWGLWLRAAKLGIPYVHVEEPLVGYRRHEGQMTRNMGDTSATDRLFRERYGASR